MSSNIHLLLFMVSTSFVSVPDCHAQTLGTALEKKAAAERASTAPATSTFVGSANQQDAQFVLDASSDKKVGTAAFGWRTGDEHFQIAFSAPLSDTTNEATPLSLTGLASGASGKLSYSRLQARVPNAEERRKMLTMCEADHLKIVVTTTTPDREKCRLENLPTDHQPEFAMWSHLEDAIWFFGAEGAMSQAKFKFVAADSLEAGSENHLNGSLTVRAGRYSPRLGFLIGAFAVGDNFESAGGPAQVCQTIEGVPGALRCQNAVVGKPTEAKRSVVSAEIRHFTKANVGLTPSIQYDCRKDPQGRHTVAVNLPIYFIGDGTNAIGGVRFGWRSDTKALSAVVFIGASVGLLPQ